MPGLRRDEYDGRSLDPAGMPPEPIAQFRRWLDDALAAEVAEPAAMTLATVDPEGRPSCRWVLLRGVDERGFAFYTNRNSAKGRDLAVHPHAALTFGWLDLYRAVRISGPVHELPDADSDAYFALRPRGAQIGAWASPQSAVLDSRAELERAVVTAEARFADGDVPRPPHWGGYVVYPEVVEFWQGRPDRLHDRVRYARHAQAASGWRAERLAP